MTFASESDDALCLGHTHALSVLVTGAAVGLDVMHPQPAQLALLTGLTAGAAVLPDIDHPNSSLAHCFGFLTKSFAWLIGWTELAARRTSSGTC